MDSSNDDPRAIYYRAPIFTSLSTEGTPDADGRMWFAVDRCFNPIDIQLRAAPDLVMERYRRASNDTGALISSDFGSMSYLWERMFWKLRHYYEDELELDPTGETPMVMINGIICDYEATESDIFLECVESDESEDWSETPRFIVSLQRDLRVHLDRSSPYFFDYWINDERYEQPPMSNAMYDIWCCIRLVIARTIWRKEYTHDGQERSFVKWDLPPSRWIAAQSEWLSHVFCDEEGRGSQEALAWLYTQAQLDEDAANDRFEGEMGSSDGTEIEWDSTADVQE
jgi:hypothetical protein